MSLAPARGRLRQSDRQEVDTRQLRVESVHPWPHPEKPGKLVRMLARANDRWPIPSAPFDDLDLDRPEDEEEWDRRVMVLAAARISAERERLEQLGVIDGNGNLISRELPPDMLPESDTSVETG